MKYLWLFFISNVFALNVFADDFCDPSWAASLTRDEVLRLIDQKVDFEQKCDEVYTPLELIKIYNYDVEVHFTLEEYFDYIIPDIFKLELASINLPKDCRFFSTDNLGRNLSWAHFPIVLWLQSSMPDKYIESFHTAAQVWEDRFNTNFFDFQRLREKSLVTSWISSLASFFSFDWPIASEEESGKSIIYWDQNLNEDNSYVYVAKTHHDHVESRIIKSTVRINATLYRYYTNTDIANDRIGEDDYHLESIIIHELGHVLGLADNDREDSIMGPFQPKEEIEELEEFDYRNILCEYDFISDL